MPHQIQIRPAIREMDDKTLDAIIRVTARDGDPLDQSDKQFIQELCQEKDVRKAVKYIKNLYGIK